MSAKPEITSVDVRMTAMGESGVLLECKTPIGLDIQKRLWTVADTVRTHEGIADAVCGMGNLLVLFDPDQRTWSHVSEMLQKTWHASRPSSKKSRQIDIPVRYGGAGGPELDALARFAGLSMHDTARLHAGASYVVFAIGSSPGFGYLGGLPAQLAMPRRPVPLLRAEKGSVAIGGSQTGVTSAAGPTGWHVIGSTELSLFDVANDPPAMLAPGDRIRFRNLGVEK